MSMTTQKKNKPLILADYASRKLDCCHFCGLKYNVGERIPRILVHCGHTFCTECLSQLHHNFRVRCPLCRKLIKNLENVEKLPLNINILYEVVERDPILMNTNFDEELLQNDENLEEKLCQEHMQRVKHFYCSNHLTIFCRECIKDYHTEQECFVVDLYEIEKMRKLQKNNMDYNRSQLKKRKNGDQEQCVVYNLDKPTPIESKESKNPKKGIFQFKEKKPVMTKEELLRTLEAYNPKLKEEFLGSFEDEEFTDEARTNEDQYEGNPFDPTTKFGALATALGKAKVIIDTEGSERFYENEGSRSSGEPIEDDYYEEGEIDPNMQQILCDRDDSD